MEPTLFIDFPGGGIRTFEITLHDIVSPAQNLAIGCNDDLHTTYRPAYRPQFMISPSQKIHCDHRRGFRKPISLDHRNSGRVQHRSEEHTSELKSLMRTSYAVFSLKKTNKPENI